MNKTLVIMAAGMGSRYGGLKQIDPVGPDNTVIIDYSIYDAVQAGFNTIAFIIKEADEAAFKAALGDRIAKHVNVRYVYQRLENLPNGYSVPAERSKPWGTAHAIMCCAGIVNEPFAVINADDYYGAEAFKKMSDWLETPEANAKETNYCMTGYVLKNTLTENGHVARGICEVGEDGMLKHVVEHTKIMRRDGQTQYTEDGENWVDVDENSIVSMNCWAFKPCFLDTLKERFEKFLAENLDKNPLKCEFFLPFVVQEMIDEGSCTVKVLHTDDRWFGVTYKEDKEVVVNAIASKIAAGQYPEHLWKE